jgi:hypothetical protein
VLSNVQNIRAIGIVIHSARYVKGLGNIARSVEIMGWGVMMMIEITKLSNGMLCASAIVIEGNMAWREWNNYEGYTRREVARMFRERMADMGYVISRGYVKGKGE